MKTFDKVTENLRLEPKNWLITGCAGFIGSNLVESLLTLNQQVVGIDNFSTGHRHNLDDVKAQVGPDAWKNFRFIEGDICDLELCRDLCSDSVDYVLHQAALGSVPRSINNPIASNHSNVTGFLNMIVAAKEAEVKKFIYAASSSTYGDHPGLPKKEDVIGRPLSPYAVTKYVNELYAEVFSRTYGIATVGLRYFNVFGRRQDPKGAYAAVIPRWIGNLMESQKCTINGDGNSSRDFCYIDNVIQANILAAVSHLSSTASVFNVAVGGRTTLNELYRMIQSEVGEHVPACLALEPEYVAFRAGDVRHSQADIQRISDCLGYSPTHTVREGLKEAVRWYCRQSRVSGCVVTS